MRAVTHPIMSPLRMGIAGDRQRSPMDQNQIAPRDHVEIMNNLNILAHVLGEFSIISIRISIIGKQ